MLVSKDFGLTLSIPKTKVMAVEREVMADDRAPLNIGGEEIKAVNEFPHLGSKIESSGRVTLDVEKRASSTQEVGPFGQPSEHFHKTQSIPSLCTVCSPILIRVLDTIEEKPAFHNRCVRTILGVSNKQQWSERITSLELRQRWGDPETAAMKVMKRRLEWLGHLYFGGFRSTNMSLYA